MIKITEDQIPVVLVSKRNKNRMNKNR